MVEVNVEGNYEEGKEPEVVLVETPTEPETEPEVSAEPEAAPEVPLEEVL